MTTEQLAALIISILVPMLAGFGFIAYWLRSIDSKISGIENRLTAIETIFMVMGYPLKKTGTEEKK